MKVNIIINLIFQIYIDLIIDKFHDQILTTMMRCALLDNIFLDNIDERQFLRGWDERTEVDRRRPNKEKRQKIDSEEENQMRKKQKYPSENVKSRRCLSNVLFLIDKHCGTRKTISWFLAALKEKANTKENISFEDLRRIIQNLRLSVFVQRKQYEPQSSQFPKDQE